MKSNFNYFFSTALLTISDRMNLKLLQLIGIQKMDLGVPSIKKYFRDVLLIQTHVMVWQ